MFTKIYRMDSEVVVLQVDGTQPRFHVAVRIFFRGDGLVTQEPMMCSVDGHLDHQASLRATFCGAA